MAGSSGWRGFLRKLRQAGWAIEVSGSGHLKAYPPNGGPYVVMPCSPSDRRSMLNAPAILRRAGWRG